MTDHKPMTKVEQIELRKRLIARETELLETIVRCEFPEDDPTGNELAWVRERLRHIIDLECNERGQHWTLTYAAKR